MDDKPATIVGVYNALVCVLVELNLILNEYSF